MIAGGPGGVCLCRVRDGEYFTLEKTRSLRRTQGIEQQALRGVGGERRTNGGGSSKLRMLVG